MNRNTLLAGLIAAVVPLAPAAALETLSATFTQPDGGVTARLYAGTVRATVSGTGFSDANAINDAFYLVAGPRHDPSYYQLTFGTAPLIGYDPAQNAVNFIPTGLPAYTATHVYSFLLDTDTTTPSHLHFGVGDGQFGDNGGAYTITVAVPEPASWALMIGGFALTGVALRRRSRAVAA